MNKTTYIIFYLIIISCSSQSRVVKNNEEIIKTDCPSDGVCSLKIEKNKSLNLKNENTSNLYPEILDGDNLILTFEYKRNEIPNTADGHYSEQLLLELDPNSLEIALEGKALQNVKLLFARFCYCKGQTGYYKINEGTLKLYRIDKDRYHISVSFSQNYVPQIINTIGETFELKKSL